MITPVPLVTKTQLSRLQPLKEANTMSKLRFFLGALCVCVLGLSTVSAQQDPRDRGEADTLLVVITQATPAGDVARAEAAVHIFNDEQYVTAAG